MTRYAFTNWSATPFDGRFGGVNYSFASQETREFDPDKHYMLIILAKQLADRELLKGITGIGRDPHNEETWGKALGPDGKPWMITKELRKTVMRKAIGELVDIPVPTPDVPSEEAGMGKEAKEDMEGMKEQIRHLTELVESMAANQAPKAPVVEPGTPPQPAQAPTVAPTPAVDEKPSMSLTRSILFEMAVEAGLPVHEGNTKEEILEMLNKPKPAV